MNPSAWFGLFLPVDTQSKDPPMTITDELLFIARQACRFSWDEGDLDELAALFERGKALCGGDLSSPQARGWLQRCGQSADSVQILSDLVVLLRKRGIPPPYHMPLLHAYTRLVTSQKDLSRRQRDFDAAIAHHLEGQL